MEEESIPVYTCPYLQCSSSMLKWGQLSINALWWSAVLPFRLLLPIPLYILASSSENPRSSKNCCVPSGEIVSGMSGSAYCWNQSSHWRVSNFNKHKCQWPGGIVCCKQDLLYLRYCWWRRRCRYRRRRMWMWGILVFCIYSSCCWCIHSCWLLGRFAALAEAAFASFRLGRLGALLCSHGVITLLRWWRV